YFSNLFIFCLVGGTGFLGKMLTEKLLRSCPDISTIYLMIRSQKDKCPKNRLDEMLENSLYDHVKKEVPNFRKKIVPIRGDFNVKDLGLSESDKNMLISKVIKITLIILSRLYTLYFNVKNYRMCTRNLYYLVCYIQVSQNIWNNFHMQIEQTKLSQKVLYNFSIFAIKVNLSFLNRIVSQWPNTYTFTKAIAEGLFKNESGDLPIGIFRPAIIISSASEPLVGWIDNMYGPSDFTRSLLLGVARFVHCGNHKANIVPVDFTANALIASAWNVHNQHGYDQVHDLYYCAKKENMRNNEYIRIFYLNQIKLIKNTNNMNNFFRMWKLYMKVEKFNKAIEEIWTEYLINYYQGMRFYQLNENDSMLKDSRTKYAR
ncbi:FACR1 reductase, partial [Acromyrmex heyeri]